MVAINNRARLKKNLIIYLVGFENNSTKFENLKEIFWLFKDRLVNYATFYIADDNSILWQDSPLPDLLKSYNIPYFEIEIPKQTKMFFDDKVQTIKKYMTKDLHEYNLLVDKNCARGRYLKFWKELYENELKEIKRFFEYKIIPVYIAESILEKLEGMLDEDLLLLHFGEISTFGEIMKVVKHVNSKIDISYIHYMS
ncbi:MAG: hypothetical protein ACFFBP_11405 [Promethearchaeota archaeon]